MTGGANTIANSVSIVTLVSSQPEVQYVALRNIDLLLQKQPSLLSKEMRVFFFKYNDPPYLKFQKLQIMVRIANDSNVEQLLAELKEYAMEVDMDGKWTRFEINDGGTNTSPAADEGTGIA